MSLDKDYSRLIAERHWNLPDKGERESRREETFIDDIIQKHHLERELLTYLDGVETAFDGGAGCGRFSILLAKRGVRVTHFDISRPMLDKARELAGEAGVLDRMEFVQGALEDLSAYRDGQFDLVLSFDAPVSYTYPHQEQVIGELARIAAKRLLLSVSSRLGSLPYLANPLQKDPYILKNHPDDPWVQWLLSSREARLRAFRFNKAEMERGWREGLMGGEAEIDAYQAGGAPWPITYLFLPDELRGFWKTAVSGKSIWRDRAPLREPCPAKLCRKSWRIPGSGRIFWISAIITTAIPMCWGWERTTCSPRQNDKRPRRTALWGNTEKPGKGNPLSGFSL